MLDKLDELKRLMGLSKKVVTGVISPLSGVILVITYL